jgi:hypothetical protein
MQYANEAKSSKQDCHLPSKTYVCLIKYISLIILINIMTRRQVQTDFAVKVIAVVFKIRANDGGET